MKKKVLFTFIFIVLFTFSTMTAVFATGDIENIITNMNGVSSVSAKYSNNGIGKMINTVVRIIQIAGTGISIIVVTIAGIKYMMASPNDKAEYKKQLVPIIIGCILLFGAVNIAGIIADFGNGFNSN